MKKDTELLIAELNRLEGELSAVKNIVSLQSEQIESLKKQLAKVSTVNIEENGVKSVESYGNLILDEILSLKKKLEGFSAEGLRNVVNDIAAMKNSVVDGETGELSLADLKSDLIKLADMITV